MLKHFYPQWLFRLKLAQLHLLQGKYKYINIINMLEIDANLLALIECRPVEVRQAASTFNCSVPK